jgi:predicted nucleotidyltransferase
MTLDTTAQTQYTTGETFDDLVQSFSVQPSLHPEFWAAEGTLIPEVRVALLKIARAFYDSIELPGKPKIKDIVFTGSLANYNYSVESDVDVHVLFDFGKRKDILTQFFLLAKARWNDAHNITVKGHDVEVYAEDSSSPHVATGLFSLLHNRWIKTPVRQRPVVDIGDVKTKVRYFMNRIDSLLRTFEQGHEVLTAVETLKEKIAKFRKSGLSTGGEFSTENITFKMLRRMGYMDKLATLHKNAVDVKLSLDELL